MSDNIGYLNNISKWHQIDFSLGNATSWGKWKNDHNINENILLISDDPVFSVDSTIELEDYKSMLVNDSSSNSILDVLRGLGQLGGTTYTPLYVSKVFKNVSPINLKSEITLKFRYGQAGLFNAYEEVVKPIIALCDYFGLNKIDDYGIQNPFPTKTEFLKIYFDYFNDQKNFFDKEKNFFDGKESELAKFTDEEGNAKKYKKLEKSEKKIIDNYKKDNNLDKNGKKITNDQAVENYLEDLKSAGSASSNNEQNILQGINEKIQSLMGVVGEKIAIKGNYKSLYIRFNTGDYGREGSKNIMFGPASYNTTSWEVDTKNLDQYGFPLSGSFIISGISSLERGVESILRKAIP